MREQQARRESASLGLEPQIGTAKKTAVCCVTIETRWKSFSFSSDVSTRLFSLATHRSLALVRKRSKAEASRKRMLKTLRSPPSSISPFPISISKVPLSSRSDSNWPAGGAAQSTAAGYAT